MSAYLQQRLEIKNRIIGVLLRDARRTTGRSMTECADLLGIPEEQYQAFELGHQAPTLPQLEVLAYYFDVPIAHFWGTETLDATFSRRHQSIRDRVPEMLMLRQRIIGLRVRELRERNGLTIDQVAEESGIAVDRIQATERGQLALPVNELEAVAQALRAGVEDLVDSHGPIGNWLQAQEEFEKFVELPPEMRAFILKPINRSYLELAIKLSEMEVDRLRTIAESILEITY